MVLETTGENDKGEGQDRIDIEAVTDSSHRAKEKQKVTIGVSLLVWGPLEKFNKGLDLKNTHKYTASGKL